MNRDTPTTHRRNSVYNHLDASVIEHSFSTLHSSARRSSLAATTEPLAQDNIFAQVWPSASDASESSLNVRCGLLKIPSQGPHHVTHPMPQQGEIPHNAPSFEPGSNAVLVRRRARRRINERLDGRRRDFFDFVQNQRTWRVGRRVPVCGPSTRLVVIRDSASGICATTWSPSCQTDGNPPPRIQRHRPTHDLARRPADASRVG
jgi:hypothetical protein